MPQQYHRRRGDRVSYTPNQTARYFSQARRYQQAQAIRPSRQESVGQNQLYYFRSDRAPTGEWRVIYNPDGGGGSGGGNPSFGLAPSCPTGCISNLQYIQLVVNQIERTWHYAYVDGDPAATGWWYGPPEPFTSMLYYRLPDSTVEPPDPWVQLPRPSRGADCSFRVTYTPVSEDSMRGDYPFHFEGVLIQIYYYGELIYEYTFGVGALTEPPSPVLSIAPDPLYYTGGFIDEVFNLSSVNFYTGSAEPLTQILCSYGDQSGGGGGGDDATWSCNCPDQVQQQGRLANSPWTSEQQGRSWSGNTHTEENGPCKHIYSAANARGIPFARPEGGNSWDYPGAPELPNFDYTPDASDWTDQDYEAWRNQQQQRRSNENVQRAAQNASRRAANQQSFDRLGISDTTVPKNRYLQARYRELYEQAQANPEAQDALDNFLLDLE